MTKPHLVLLAQLREAIASGKKKSTYDICVAFLPHVVVPGRMDEVVAAMGDEERESFLREARNCLDNAEMQVEEGWPTDPDRDWSALGAWVYRQPFAERPLLPLTEIGAMVTKQALIWLIFEHLIPHFAKSAVDEVIRGLVPEKQWTRRLLPLVEMLRPGLDVVVATARAHDRAPEAFMKLNAWALGIRPHPYWPRHEEMPVPPESSWAPPVEGSHQPPCPFCGAPSGIRMVYGDGLAFETYDRADRREIIIAGGLGLRNDKPTHQCRRCAKRFFDPVTAAKRSFDGNEVPIDEWIGRVIAALGQPDAVVTDLTRVNEFIDGYAWGGVGQMTWDGPLLDFRARPDAVRANAKLIADAERALGLTLDTDEKIIHLARRLREKDDPPGST